MTETPLLMIVLEVLRAVAVAAGTVVTFRDCMNARWLVRVLRDARINGDRQAMAAYSLLEAALRLVVQVGLCVPATTSFFLPLSRLEEYSLIVVVNLTANMLAAFVLAVKSIYARRFRDAMFDRPAKTETP